MRPDLRDDGDMRTRQGLISVGLLFAVLLGWALLFGARHTPPALGEVLDLDASVSTTVPVPTQPTLAPTPAVSTGVPSPPEPAPSVAPQAPPRVVVPAPPPPVILDDDDDDDDDDD